MKAEIVSEYREPGFAPVTIKITLESAEELRQVWHRFNLSLPNLKKGYYKPGDFECDFADNPQDISEVWEVLDNVLGSREIRP